MIKTVIRAANNMVITFDEQGNQMPDYQGWYEEVKRKIITDTEEYNVLLGESLESAQRESFFNLSRRILDLLEKGF